MNNEKQFTDYTREELLDMMQAYEPEYPWNDAACDANGVPRSTIRNVERAIEAEARMNRIVAMKQHGMTADDAIAKHTFTEQFNYILTYITTTRKKPQQ